jgi:hypothetical protein
LNVFSAGKENIGALGGRADLVMLPRRLAFFLKKTDINLSLALAL